MKSKKNRPPEPRPSEGNPPVFFMEFPEEWARLQETLPREAVAALMQDIAACPHCTQAHKDRARQELQAMLN